MTTARSTIDRVSVLPEATMLAFIATALSIALWLGLRIDANWDEFHFLSHVFLAREGTLAQALNTFHVHFFGWLALIGEHALDRIVAARAVMWVLLVASTAMTYAIARRFQSRRAALFSVLCLAGFSYVLEHGASFRFDPIAIFLALLAAWLYLRATVPGVAAAGIAAAMALLVTIKSVLVIPAVAGLVGWQLVRQHRAGLLSAEIRRAVVFTLSCVAATIGLFLLHKSGLAEASVSRIGASLSDSAFRMFIEPIVMPRYEYFVRSATENPVFHLAFWSGLLVLMARALWAPAGQRLEALALLLLATPVLAILYYRNAYPYYYVFALPFAVLLCGIAFDSITRHSSPGTYLNRRRRLVTALLALLLAFVLQRLQVPFHGIVVLALPLLALDELLERLTARGRAMVQNVMLGLALTAIAASMISTTLAHSQRTQNAQRTLMQGVHAIFPEPVPYIDRSSMMPEFPKVGFFMSTWGMDAYHDRGEPIMRQLIEQHQPRFVLDNHHALSLGLPSRSPQGLLDEDIEVLQGNYIPHWGPVWVAGKQVEATSEASERFEILIAGRYRLEADLPVSIDGRTVRPGDDIELSAGDHELISAGEQLVTLRLAEAGTTTLSAPREPLFYGFRKRE